MWLPFTQMAACESVRSFVRGDGCFLYDSAGNRVFDAVSSIWTTVHGHCHPAIVQAVSRQAATLDHATLLGASHPRAEELAERLASLLRLDRVFFASDGASAVEAAIKIALQFWQLAGETQRTRFVRLVDAYHGDTIGAMSLSDIAVFKTRYGAVTFETIPYDRDLAPLERADVAAVIVEPLVQAAAGIRLVPRERYARLRGIRPLLIVDEIATGFGRTGTMFACEQAELNPDIVCVGKGITGGSLPLSATVVKERVFEAFSGEPGEMRHFLHGHSYAGNPIACAAAIANLDLFATDGTLDRVRRLTAEIATDLDRLAKHPLVREVRGLGLMIGIELREEVIAADGAPTAGWRISNDLYARGHFTRPIGAVIQFVPPLSSAASELHRFLADLGAVLNGARAA